MDTAAKRRAAVEDLRAFDGVLVAFSGGVASSFGVRELVWRPGSVVAPVAGGFLMVDVSMASVFYIGGGGAVLAAGLFLVVLLAGHGTERCGRGDPTSAVVPRVVGSVPVRLEKRVMLGTVRRTHVAPERGADPDPVDSAEPAAGRGLRGTATSGRAVLSPTGRAAT